MLTIMSTQPDYDHAQCHVHTASAHCRIHSYCSAKYHVHTISRPRCSQSTTIRLAKEDYDSATTDSWITGHQYIVFNVTMGKVTNSFWKITGAVNKDGIENVCHEQMINPSIACIKKIQKLIPVSDRHITDMHRYRFPSQPPAPCKVR